MYFSVNLVQETTKWQVNTSVEATLFIGSSFIQNQTSLNSRHRRKERYTHVIVMYNFGKK